MSFKGEVCSVEYTGSSVRMGITQSLSSEFSVTCSEGEFFNQPIKVGDELFLSWEKKDIHILEV